jgi:hypothetical protein
MTFESSELPSLVKEGWPRHQTNVAKHPLMERTRWFVHATDYRLLNEPPRLREQRWLREIFLIAQPPLLNQGGEWLAPNIRLFEHAATIWI